MKKHTITMLIITLLLAISMLAGCGGGEDTSKPTAAPTQAPTKAPTQVPEATATPIPTEAPTQTPELSPFEYSINYVTDGLFALYEGACNTRDQGLLEDWNYWEDLSTNENDLEELPLSDQLYFDEDGLFIESQLIAFPEIFHDTINAGEFTIELQFGDLELTGTSWICFIQDYANNHDQLSFYYNVGAGELTLKLNNNDRPKFKIAPEDMANHTYSVTVSKTDGVAIMYQDGVEVSRASLTKDFSVISLCIGHRAAERCYTGVYESIRFYSRALTADEIAQNAALENGITTNR